VPTYQYVCTECGGQLEAVQKFTDEPLTTHEACGGRLRKVFSPVGIVFKGSGFYRTDSRNGSASSSSSTSAASSSTASDASSSTKSSSDPSSTSSSTSSDKSGKSGKSGSSSGSGEKAA
jgi:putative FmdB family regulatory protein